jgi:hypothetical protein
MKNRNPLNAEVRVVAQNMQSMMYFRLGHAMACPYNKPMAKQ